MKCSYRFEKEIAKMICIPIDENSCIIQPYYDGGESYEGHKKYSLIGKYKSIPENCIEQRWDGFHVCVAEKSVTTIECEDVNIDVLDFQKFRVFGLIPEHVHLKLYCNDELVIDKKGNGKGYIDGDVTITQKNITSLRYELENTQNCRVIICLFYLGMINDKVKIKNPFTAEWEGFFEENPNCDLFNENLISRQELELFREKIHSEPYKSIYSQMKKQALEAMNVEPEPLISKTIRKYHRAPWRINGAKELAIVGQVERNQEMLKMACRYALSIGCFEYWCADVMETVPTITWHHRSFDEADMITEICTVISMAGGMLSWHGRNFLYNMIIMKGLPRIEADFMTMEYIYKCNQGIAFMQGYLFGLITLTDCYPRYKMRIKEASRLLDEMLENSFKSDGGYAEGGHYWLYIVSRYLGCAHLLARYEKMNVSKVVGHRLDKTAEFGLAVLDENAHILTFNDSSAKAKYGIMVPAILYDITQDMRWAGVFHKNIGCGGVLDMLLASTVEVPPYDGAILNEFSYFSSVGLVQIYRDRILFAATAGPSNSTHAHCDKGSFIVCKEGEIIVPDCTSGYDSSEHAVLDLSESHSLALPIIDGHTIEQCKGNGYEAVVKCSRYENGRFEWECNTSKIWNSPLVMKSKRRIESDKLNEFIIIDEFEFTEPIAVEFRLNVCKNDAINLQPQNWLPELFVERILQKNGEHMIWQKCLRSDKQQKCRLITKLIIL